MKHCYIPISADIWSCEMVGAVLSVNLVLIQFWFGQTRLESSHNQNNLSISDCFCLFPILNRSSVENTGTNLLCNQIVAEIKIVKCTLDALDVPSGFPNRFDPKYSIWFPNTRFHLNTPALELEFEGGYLSVGSKVLIITWSNSCDMFDIEFIRINNKKEVKE